MTTIAWDGKTLAADKQATNHDCGIGITTKVYRINGCLVAGAGSADVFHSMVRWFSMGADVDAFPDIQAETNDATLLVITPESRIMIYDRTPFSTIIENKFWAMGSGRDFALAALHLGCDARRAVEIACELDVYSGNGIDTLSL